MDLASKPPRAIWMMGVLTILPLFAASAVFCFGPQHLRAAGLVSLIAYATALLSYLGGIHAGLEIDKPQPRWLVLGLSLAAPAVAWLLLLGGDNFGPVWQIAGVLTALLLQWLWDATSHDGPSWRPRLRTLLTAGAAIALAVALEQAMSL
ncbi:DUF3429 domain-containing protein [Caulobacter segnis]|uniref:DUF3429 domain-containing protein n=1 Tax=Caulobacter segnis TaxID=88688 RepID=UPI00240EE2CC|nr:DUF3429 domain-containing protein [Caulobacter segnis]MDG2523176.1 DUF3429 domain-containing protein [Caulobacter segnis]